MPEDKISCGKNNACTGNMENAAEDLQMLSREAALGLAPGSARTSTRFDCKLPRTGAVAKPFKGSSVPDARWFR